MAMTIAERESGGRALVPGLETARPLASTLPSLLQEDDFCVRLTSAFDEALAPVVATLDCFGTYLDPRLAPQDFVDWLAGWVGVETDETWPPERRRNFVAEAIDVYHQRGTRAGLVRHIELYSGVVPSVEESGGCTWSQEAGGDLPGSPQPRLAVRVELDEPGHVDAAVVDRIVRSSRPAHVPHEVHVLIRSVLGQGDEEQALPGAASDWAEEALDVLGDGEASLDAPAPVHPPEASVVEVGPGVPTERDEPEAEATVTSDLVEDDDTGAGLGEATFDRSDAAPADGDGEAEGVSDGPSTEPQSGADHVHDLFRFDPPSTEETGPATEGDDPGATP